MHFPPYILYVLFSPILVIFLIYQKEKLYIYIYREREREREIERKKERWGLSIRNTRQIKKPNT
jgi:hypothetical protein